jgi:hypothetical protein
VLQDWTSGMESLKEYVNASSKSYRWFIYRAWMFFTNWIGNYSYC